MTHQTETAELIQAAAKLDPSAWLSAEGTPVRLHPDAAAALGGLLVAIAHTDDETLNKASLVRSAALTAARVVAASSLDAACAHCGSNDHTWDDCEAYTRLTADAYARTLNTPPSAETCAAIRDRLHSGSEPAAVSAAVAPPTGRAALRCVCGDPIEWRDYEDGSGWIHSPGSDTPCLDARPATDEIRAQLLHAIDHAYTTGVLGYTSPEDLLAAYDNSRTPATSRAAALERVRALHQPMQRGPFTICAHCSGWDGEWRCRGVVTDYPCPTISALTSVEPAALRRMADETATKTPDAPHPPHDSWLVEWRADGGDWNVAYPTHDHTKALDRLARGRQDAPDWQWRIVRETTTYTVEQPAAGARQDEPTVTAPSRQTDETPDDGPACAHCGGNHAWDNCEAYTKLVAAEGPDAGARP